MDASFFRCKQILIIDDCAPVRASIKAMAQQIGFESIHLARDANEAIAKAHELPFDFILCDFNLGEGKDGYQLFETLKTRQLLALPQPPDGIFCCSDYMAQGCYQAIAEAGLRIPEDIRVAGHDNQMLASEMEPPLSSIELPYDEMGKQAVDTLLQLAQGEKPIALQMKLEGELLIRASTRGQPVNRL